MGSTEDALWQANAALLAEILVYRCRTRGKALDAIRSAPKPPDETLVRDCAAYYEMWRMIQAPGEPRTPLAAATDLARRCPEHMRENFIDRWRKGYKEYEATGGPLFWVRKGRANYRQMPHREAQERIDRMEEDIDFAPTIQAYLPWTERRYPQRRK